MTDPAVPAGLDPVDRLDILAAALPGAAVGRRRLAAPFAAVWQVIADLENATARYEPGVAGVRITEQRGESLRLLVQDTAGREMAMDARLRPGWCVMQSAILVIAFAARPVGSETLLAHLEFWRGPVAAPGSAPPAVSPVAVSPPAVSPAAVSPAALAKIDQELRTIERLALDYGR
ncbi:MAG TPA: hypothetical protein VIZ00_06040 [Streptosporangiaceae bacterium]